MRKSDGKPIQVLVIKTVYVSWSLAHKHKEQIQMETLKGIYIKLAALPVLLVGLFRVFGLLLYSIFKDFF